MDRFHLNLMTETWRLHRRPTYGNDMTDFSETTGKAADEYLNRVVTNNSMPYRKLPGLS